MFRYRKLIFILFGLIILMGIAWMERQAIFNAISDLQPTESLLSLSALVIANVFSAFLFAAIIRARQKTLVSSSELAGTFLVAQSAKYAPGKVWPILLQASYLNRRIGTALLTITNIDVSLISMAVTATMGVSIIIWVSISPIVAITLMISALSTTYLTAKWRILDQFSAWLFCRITRSAFAPLISDGPTTAQLRAMPFLSVLAGFAFAYFLGWSLFAGPALGNGWSDGVLWTALIALSYVIGLASLFPAGIGVRELSMVGIAPFLGLDSDHAAGIAVLSRLFLITIDLAGITVGAVLLLREDRRTKW